MAFQRTASICLCIVITSAIAYGQRQSEMPGQQNGPGRATSEPSYWTFWDGYVAPLRRLTTQTDADGRKIVRETVEGPDIGGRQTTLEEVLTETTEGPGTTHTRQEVFRPGVNGRQELAETTDLRQDTQPDGNSVAVQRRWVADVNGRLRLRSQLVEDTRWPSPDVQQIDSTLLVPGINDTLREAHRSQYSEHRLGPELARHERTDSVRDVNGRWKPVEIRRGEVRRTGSAEVVEEETVQRPDLNGNLAIDEVNVIRRSGTEEDGRVVVETYAGASYERGVNGQPPLDQRIQRTTTATADGGSYTVEEFEERSRVSPASPLRMVRRIVTTITPSGDGGWVTQSQIFEVDVNGRLRLVRTE
jgi:hypothetical protein